MNQNNNSKLLNLHKQFYEQISCDKYKTAKDLEKKYFEKMLSAYNKVDMITGAFKKKNINNQYIIRGNYGRN
jgi:poly-D-alanine transfer protein DltD